MITITIGNENYSFSSYKKAIKYLKGRRGVYELKASSIKDDVFIPSTKREVVSLSSKSKLFKGELEFYRSQGYYIDYTGKTGVTLRLGEKNDIRESKQD